MYIDHWPNEPTPPRAGKGSRPRADRHATPPNPRRTGILRQTFADALGTDGHVGRLPQPPRRHAPAE